MTEYNDEEIVNQLNALSPDAFYMVELDVFGSVIAWQPVLLAAQNERQENAFNELLGIGYVYLDTERGIVGYRSTHKGQYANALIRGIREYEREQKANGN